MCFSEQVLGQCGDVSVYTGLAFIMISSTSTGINRSKLNRNGKHNELFIGLHKDRTVFFLQFEMKHYLLIF